MKKEMTGGGAVRLALTPGDISEGEIEKAISRPGETKINRERGNEETVRMALRRQNERGKGASEMPGAPIKVEIVGFANVNPTLRRLGERNSGRNKLL